MTIVKYLLYEFFKVFFLVFISLVLLFLIGDLISNFNLVFAKGFNVFYLIKYLFLRIPEALVYIFPFSSITAGMILFSSLNKRFELIAFRTLCIPKKIIIFSLIVAGFIISVFHFFNNEFLFPTSNYQAKLIRNIYLKKNKNFATLKMDKIWLRKKNYFFKIGLAVYDEGYMKDIVILKLNERFLIDERIDANFAVMIDGKWFLKNGSIRKFGLSGIKKYRQFKYMEMPINLFKEEFVVISSKVSELSIFKILHILTSVDNKVVKNINLSKYKTELVNKILLPAISIIFLIFSFFVNLFNPRGGSGSGAIAVSVLFGLTFFVVQGFFVNLGYNSILWPYLAPFFPFILFGVIIFYMIKKIKY